ncbi:MAG: histidine phosphatase family protein [Clostridia bacterium]|nr:histidine phosphatase family protein [Clostridia bacterium]
MTTLYLVRHCEATGNVLKQYQGSIDADITENGANQLKLLSKRFENIKIDKFYSSPLKRAQLTARSVADKKGMDVEIVKDLTEIAGGIFEGMTFEEIFRLYPEEENNWNHQPHLYKSPEGESMRAVYDRAVKAINQIIADNKDKTIFVASHGGVIRTLMCYFLKVDFNNLNSVGWTKNTGVNIIEIDSDGNIKVVKENSLEHLSGDMVIDKMF